MDKDHIVLEGMRFYAYHGRNPEERAVGQAFEVDLEVYLDLRSAGKSDDINDTINYSELYRSVKAQMEGKAKSLLEAVAESIADEVLKSYSATNVVVRIRKAIPPIKGAYVGGVGVQVSRSRT